MDFARFGPVERRNLSRIKKIFGANLHRNWVMIPHVTNHEDADITELEAFRVQINKEREKAGIKVTMLAFLVKACVAALKKFPEFNASLDGEQIVRKQYYHIGFAADTPNGLLVPVIREADKKVPHHQRARSRDPQGMQVEHEAAEGWRDIRAEADPAAVWRLTFHTRVE